jgi:hypothetical protein
MILRNNKKLMYSRLIVKNLLNHEAKNYSVGRPYVASKRNDGEKIRKIRNMLGSLGMPIKRGKKKNQRAIEFP